MNLTQLRFQNQQLDGSSLQTGHELVQWFGAVQGQEYGPTKWGLGLRLAHLKDADVEHELEAGKILRTHLLRPTWHFVAAEDIRWMVLLTAPRVHQANAYMYRQLALDASVFNPCNDLIVTTLEGQQQRTREEIAAEFRQHGILAEGHRLSYIMMQAELEGIVCGGARRGNQFTYTLLEERV
ncbi:MAG: winged helix DNA-binding domain-containing protein, partial [Phycisphaerae bacterium]|nr:winged helix DNA-binding domain-containing protein [Saprospiraceae bacterium]